ncbi:MAG: hypothetical protein H8K08_08510 [Nitrospira sp.]|nr:hypothetical protein [Nitrospira sp.]
MSSEVLPVTFCNKAGNRLFGMLHLPDKPHASGTGIILLSPGVKMRVAPHRLYINMTQRFVELGYPVLRFDFYGLGDSEGEAQEEYLADLYGAIQVGRYIDDTIVAMDWLQRAHGLSQFIVSGLCGGAITGLLTAAQDSRIVGLLGLSIPVILDGSKIDFGKYMTDAQLRVMRDSYLSKMMKLQSWRSWIRFLAFQSDYRAIFRSIVKPLIVSLRRTKEPIASSPQVVEKDNTNPYFAQAFQRMIATSRPILLIFAEMDRLYWEFQKKFEERHRGDLALYRGSYEVHLVKQANHILSFQEWEAEMLDQSCHWLKRVSLKDARVGY